MIKSVYIASPYTLGDVGDNVGVQLRMHHTLMDLGFTPYTPLYTHFVHMIKARSYEEWMEFDEYWLLKCDALLRLPGESRGADREVETARKHGILVFFTLEDLVRCRDAG